MQILESNKIALQKRMPQLWDALFAFIEDNKMSTDLQLDVAKDGNQIDVMTMKDGAVYMQSQYRPLEEAKRFAKQYAEAKPHSCFLFLGIGNGYVLRELLTRQDISYILYEPSLQYFIHVLMHYDISDILLAGNVHFYVAGLNDSELKLDMYRHVNRLNWHLFYLDAMPKYKQLYPKVFEELAILYRDSQVHGKQNYDAVNVKGPIEFENVLMNLRYLYKSNSICAYKGVLTPEIPVVIVAAGPSLEKNISYLKECRNQVFILCVDRVAPILAKYGIQPHAYVTVDCNKELELFQDEQVSNAPWFTYTSANYKGLELLHNPDIIFASSICRYGGYLYQCIGSDLQELRNGGSVATVAAMIALELGSKTIILIGQDLALTGNKEHIGEAEKSVFGPEGCLLTVKGYDGNPVTTRQDFKAYLDWYEAFATKHRDVQFVNATEGGAWIEGMEHISLVEAVNKYGIASIDGDALLKQIPLVMTSEKQMIIRNEYLHLERYFHQIQAEVKNAIRWMEIGIEILEKRDLQNPKLGKAEKVMGDFQELYNSYAGHFVLDMVLGKEIQNALLDLDFTKDDVCAELKRLYTKMLEFYQGVEGAVTRAIPLLNTVLQKIEEE